MPQANISQSEIDLWLKFQSSPIYGIEKMWGLVPQPLKPEWEDVADVVPLRSFKPHWFQPFIKGKHITWQQWVFFKAVEQAVQGKIKPLITVEAGHGTGKSASLAMLMLWYLAAFKNCQIPCTAPTSTQIHDILWKEANFWISQMPLWFKSRFYWTKDYIRITENPEVWFARAKTGDKENTEALAGIHAPFVLIMVDEASGVPNQVFTTAEGSLTGGNILFVQISQHKRLTGFFHDSHKEESDWLKLRFNAEESPIVEPGYPEYMANKYGKDSDEYRVEVKGMGPKEDSVDDGGYTVLFNETDIREIQDEPFMGRVRLGIDPGGLGNDPSVWVARDGFKAKVVGIEKKSTPKSIAKKTLQIMKMYNIQGEDIFCDNFGEGANVGQELAIVKVVINAVNVGDDATAKNRYLNKRAECFDRGKKWARSGGEFIEHENWKELLVIRGKAAGETGRYKIMSKEEMRKKKIKSPNTADAYALTFYHSEDSEEFSESQEFEYDRFGRPVIRT